jgi:hypothetical protein
VGGPGLVLKPGFSVRIEEQLWKGFPPRFPVETRGVDGLHAALFTESRTRGPCQQREVGNLGSPIVFGPRALVRT